ncbi:hypothetical protein P154DRAFT_569869 [Amniculicola lignicola CBS 123094]|uniref:SWIM-type domain-containing protein n=1 Tax=Amniculicola lignicola CBS 123094 TaxID=1392246 RepID=A0A6A5WY03_9PLEO|nr:hypothetical protein P154DRAFT_569869 [Amniculicola lignicola CBS 123094]
MPKGKMQDSEFRYLYGWRWGSIEIDGTVKEFDPTIVNIVTGAKGPHHCTCKKAPTKACYHELHLAFCCAIIGPREVDGVMIEESICGHKFSPKSPSGCAKHPYHDGHNEFFKLALKDEAYTLPTDIPQLAPPKMNHRVLQDAVVVPPQLPKAKAILHTGARGRKPVKLTKAEKAVKRSGNVTTVEDSTGTISKRSKWKEAGIAIMGMAGLRGQDRDALGATYPPAGGEIEEPALPEGTDGNADFEITEDMPEEEIAFRQANPNADRKWFQEYKNYQQPREFKEKVPAPRKGKTTGKLQQGAVFRHGQFN